MSRQIHVGGVAVGGGAPVIVQSMTSTSTADACATLDQIVRLAAAGCELVRDSLTDAHELAALDHIVEHSPLPVIADIHFDYRLALAALEHGVAGIRINPGTIGPERVVREIVAAANEGRQRRSRRPRRVEGGETAARARARDDGQARPTAIRIGVNAGSLPRRLRGRAQSEPVAALVEAAVGFAERFEEWGFSEFKISVKSSSVPDTIAAYRLLSQRSAAPLHLGVTEAGTAWSGAIKSAVGIGTLLAEGIGDTVRVSLTGDPVEEVRVAWAILAALDLRRRGPNLISCPTCGRTELDLAGIAGEVERRLQSYTAPISVAVMGCRVNGPEEARHADFGIAGGRGQGIVFARGEKVVTVPEDELVERLFVEIDRALAGSAAKGE